MNSMLTALPDALVQLLEQLPYSLPSSETLPLKACRGRVLSDDVIATAQVPPFDNSAMDGYAFRAADLPGELPVVQRIPAGSVAQPLLPGTAARLFTGAMIPEGADVVVAQEDTQARDNSVVVLGCAQAGQHIRRAGADIATGEAVLRAGRVLTAQDLGLAASVGLDCLSVRQRLRVAVLTTGDELVAPGQPLAVGQIYNSNSVQLSALLEGLGCEVVAEQALPDDPAVIGDVLERTASNADVIVTCGGVSVGEEDHVRAQIEQRGTLALWRLAIKPGKPLAFGHVCGCPVFGLPGNPVSAWATMGLVVKPWLMQAQGAKPAPSVRFPASAAFSVRYPGRREEYLRVCLEAGQPLPIARLSGSQSSGVLSSVSHADALAIIPIGKTVSEGDTVAVIPMANFLDASSV